jgi:hypothetical protein
MENELEGGAEFFEEARLDTEKRKPARESSQIRMAEYTPGSSKARNLNFCLAGSSVGGDRNAEGRSKASERE